MKAAVKGESETVHYPSGVVEGLFEPCHRKRMGEAIWLFGWLVSKQTNQVNGVGLVLGGMVMNYAEVADRTGFPLATIRRWAGRLRRAGYIVTVRTPHGFRWQVLKAKKFRRDRPPKYGQSPRKRESPNVGIAVTRCGQGHAQMWAPGTAGIHENATLNENQSSPTEVLRGNQIAAAPPTEQDKKKVREAILRLKSEINPGVWGTWVRKLEAGGRNGSLLILAPNEITHRWLEGEDGSPFLDQLAAHIGEPISIVVQKHY